MFTLFWFGVAAGVAMGLAVPSRSRQRDYLHGTRSATASTAVQIICGNCSGDDEIPVKTFMSRDGACDRCGGDCYFLASDRGLLLRARGWQPVRYGMRSTPEYRGVRVERALKRGSPRDAPERIAV